MKQNYLTSERESKKGTNQTTSKSISIVPQINIINESTSDKKSKSPSSNNNRSA